MRFPEPHCSSVELVCAICGDRAEGFHFGAVSCAACGAFFRRSVSDQKVYSCSTRKCSVRFEVLKKGATCRYCRFAKCLNSGMMPHEVRAKRSRQPFRGDLATVSPSAIIRQIKTGSIIELLINVRRDIKSWRSFNQIIGGRSYSIELQSQPHATFSSLKRSMAAEFNVFRQLIMSHSVVEDLLTKQSCCQKQIFSEGQWHHVAQNNFSRDMFLLFFVFETAWNTVSRGGVQLDRFILTDNSSGDLADASFETFFRSEKVINDPACMARLCSSFFKYLVRNLGSALQMAHLDETELAILFYMCLFQVVPKPFRTDSVEKTRTSIFNELARAMNSIGADFSTKMGNLLLLVTPMLQSLNYFNEFVLLIDLFGPNWCVET